jgi:hypothetical protein
MGEEGSHERAHQGDINTLFSQLGGIGIPMTEYRAHLGRLD